MEYLAEILGVTRRTVERNIKALREAGLVDRNGSDKNGTWEIVKK